MRLGVLNLKPPSPESWGPRLSKTLLMAMFVLCLLPTVNGQESKDNPDAYTGVAIGTGGPSGGKSIQFDFRVTRYTTEGEVDEYAALLKSKGQDALVSAADKLDAGRINVVGKVGNQIAFARKRQSGNQTIITIVTVRNMPFMELYNSGRSTDYPFGYLQVKLDEKGQGTGQIMASARLRFNKKEGHFEIESFGNQYIKAVNVRPNK
jgi:hypothetical protein